MFLSLSRRRMDTKLDIALVMCPGWGVVQPPVGISYLKAFLKKFGLSAKCFDLSLELYEIFSEKKYWDLNYPDHFITPRFFERDILPELRPFIKVWAEKILSHNPTAVGLSLFMSSVNTSILLARQLKQMKPELVILGGGAEVTRIKKTVADGGRGFVPINRDIFNAFDALIDGEGEYALVEILSLINKKLDFYHVDGICYERQGGIVANKPREIIKDQDILPPPDYSDFRLKNYTRGALPIVTSRGCINRCTFCADSPLWKTYRQRSPQKVLEEIMFLIRKYRMNAFEIVDSIFNGDIQRLHKLCDMIIDSGINIFWSAKVLPRKEMSYDLLKRMKDSGCNSLSYGVESGSPDISKDMRKNIDLDISKKIIKDTHRAGIEANCFFIIGYPTETEKDFKLTLDFIRENAESIYRFDQVTGCHIEDDSYLGLNLEKYGIVFKEDGWYSKESTPGIRKERLQRFRKLARELHKHYKCEVQL